MIKLFEPFEIRGLKTRNRAWIAPMCQYSCENQDGIPTNWHLVHYGARAAGGAGLVIVEATAVVPEGRISPWCTGIWSEEHVAAWQPITAFAHSQGAKIAVQLAHAGRKGSTKRHQSSSENVPLEDGGWLPVAPSAISFENLAVPHVLTLEEIQKLVLNWGQAGLRAKQAGFDAVEIHSAHGYLLHEFLSPLSNHRNDQYGGTLENRARLLIEIVRELRRKLGEQFPIFVRFSATDYAEGGFDEAQTAIVARWCAEAGADLFDISSGGLIPGVKIPTGPGYQVPLAEHVADEISSPVSAVGLITSGAQAEAILQAGKVEVILIGRAALRDPAWPLRAASELGVDVDYWPIQYARGKF